MTAQNGALLLLKVGNGAGPETFTTVGGMRLTRMLLNNRGVEANVLGGGRWRAMMTGGGFQSLSVSASGAFTNAAAEETLRGYAFAGSVNNYKLTFGNGHSLTGAFMIAQYERVGPHDAEEAFSLTLESAGAITYAAS